MAEDIYIGDARMDELLRQSNASVSIYGLYGLLYGIFSGTHIVMPSKVISVIFGNEAHEFESEHVANTFLDNLFFLWNALTNWDPETDPLFVPDIQYAEGEEGLKQRAMHDLELIEWVLKGLDLCGTVDDDFTEETMKALKTLSYVSILLSYYAGIKILEEDDEYEPEFSIDHLEDIMATCIGNINIGLKEARNKAIEIAMPEGPQSAKSTKVPRNAPCPCGSGKKYKKCCGRAH